MHAAIAIQLGMRAAQLLAQGPHFVLQLQVLLDTPLDAGRFLQRMIGGGDGVLPDAFAGFSTVVGRSLDVCRPRDDRPRRGRIQIGLHTAPL